MSVAVRVVTAADLVPLARLHAACFPDDAWDSTALAGVMTMRGASGRFAEEDRAMRGFLFAVLHETEAEILTLGVHPLARRRGVARLLLDDLFARAGAIGVGAVILEVAADNAPGLTLYRSCGFRTVGQRPGYYRRGATTVDAWLLRRELA